MSGRTMPELDENLNPELQEEIEELEEKEERKGIVSWKGEARDIQLNQLNRKEGELCKN